METRYDFVIVGSGVSGGYLAGLLVKSGAKCLLLEAGKSLNPKSFPLSPMDLHTQSSWGGGVEFSRQGNLSLYRAKCLGGGSVVSQALVDRVDNEILEDWAEITEVEAFKPSNFSNYYDTVEAVLRPYEIPRDAWNRNAEIYLKGFEREEYYWKPVKRAAHDCQDSAKSSDCIVCLGGCPRDSKYNSLTRSILPAIQAGLEVQSEVEVQTFQEKQDHVEISARDKNGALTHYQTHHLVLAAGSFGTTEILLRSGLKKYLPALGTNVSCHPQFVSFGMFEEIVDAHRMAFSAVTSNDSKLRRLGVKMDSIGIDPVFVSMLLPGARKSLLKNLAHYRNLASISVSLRDESNGNLSLDRSGRLQFDKPTAPKDRHRIQQGLNLSRNFLLAAGAKSLLPKTQIFGLYLAGGCSLGTDLKTSVVSPQFKLHGSQRVSVTDASLFPSAPGTYPSLTIMATTQLAYEHLRKPV